MKFYKRFFTLSKSLEVAFVLGIACAFILSAQTANSAPNPELNYQGKLTDASNIAVPDGTYNMRFWLLTSPSIATTSAIWTESLTGSNRVQVTNGLFSVMLGSTSPLTSVDFDQALYLGVEIGGTGGSPSWDGEMSPRKILGTVPAAFQATQADNADTVGGVASTSFLRADQADTATALLTFQSGFLSQASSTIMNLTTLTATTTYLVVNNERFSDLTGTGLSNNSGTLTLNTSYLDTLYATSTDFDTCSELATLLGGDTTGTCGNVVFSASPTFTGTVNAAAATLSSTLTLSGTAANIALGSNYLSGDGDDEGIFVDSSGEVGIGTTSPFSRLTVAGDITPDSTLTYDLGSSTRRFDNLWAQTLNVGTSTWSIFNGSNGRLAFSNAAEQGGTEHLSILSSGNVGIGTSTPSQLLTVAGNARITGALYDNSNTAGSNGMVLQSTGSGFSWVATSTLGISGGSSGAGVILSDVEVFTSSGTWTKPNDLIYAVVEVRGGGGGGGGATPTNGAAGGGQGGFSRELILAASLSSTETVTRGAGGTAGNTSGGNGGTGGTSSFGSHLSATGGAGGLGSASGAGGGGAGGTGSGGDINISGVSGGYNPGSASAISGKGGGEGGGASVSGGGFNGISGSMGGGGSGASAAGGTSRSGGTGGDGYVIVYEYTSTGLSVGSVADGLLGQVAYYGANGADLSATSSLYIAASGSIGIGTTTPNQKLSIFKNAADAAIELSAASGANSKWTFGLDYSDGGKFKISSSSALGTNDRLVIDGAGRIGIGTSTPSQLLTVAGGARITGALYDNSNSAGSNGMVLQTTGSGFSWVATSSLGISTSLFTDSGAVTYLTSLSDNFAIGTTTAVSRLTIQSTSTDDILNLLETGGAEVFTVLESGNVGIGTTSPSKKLSVTDTVSDAQFILAYDDTRAGYFQIDSVGDLLIDASGGDVKLNDNNLWICESGSCPALTASSSAGYTIVENGIYFGNGFKIDQIAGTTTELGVYNASGSVIVIFEQQ